MTAAERALMFAVTDAVVSHLRNPMDPEAMADALANLGRLKARVVEDIASGDVRAL